jgi:hypothetical protein
MMQEVYPLKVLFMRQLQNSGAYRANILIQNESDANLTYSNRVGKFASDSLCVKILDSMSLRVLQLPLIFSLFIFGYLTGYESTHIKAFDFSIGSAFARVKLHINSTPTVSSENLYGSLWGVVTNFDYKIPSILYVNVNGSWLENHISGPQNDRRHFQELGVEGRLGYFWTPKFALKWKTILYTGFGYGRITQKYIPQNSLSHITVIAPIFYVPIGIISSYAIHSAFQIALHFKWMPQVYAWIENSLIKHGNWRLKNTDGLLLEFPLIYQFQWCRIDGNISFIPFWRVLNKGSGVAVNALGQNTPIPPQQYNFWGVKLCLGINF